MSGWKEEKRQRGERERIRSREDGQDGIVGWAMGDGRQRKRACRSIRRMGKRCETKGSTEGGSSFFVRSLLGGLFFDNSTSSTIVPTA